MSMNGAEEKKRKTGECPVGMHLLSIKEQYATGCSYVTDIDPAYVCEDAYGNLSIKGKPIYFDPKTCYWASKEELNYKNKAKDLEESIKYMQEKSSLLEAHENYIMKTLIEALTNNIEEDHIDIIKNRVSLFDYIDRLEELIKSFKSNISAATNSKHINDSLAKEVRGVN